MIARLTRGPGPQRALLIPLFAIVLGLAVLAAFAVPRVSAAIPSPANRIVHVPDNAPHAAPGRPNATAWFPRATTPHYRAAALPLLSRHLDVAPPGPRLIVLSPGDTLSGLALRYGTTVPALQELNGLGASTLIYAGATIRVPAAGPHGAGGISGAGSNGAATAIGFAEAQLGKVYIWGGTGPRGYDCSGLVMRAWQAAGVSLPRTTYAQVNAGTRITRDDLAPGDLVFTNNDGHVELYIGRGQVIQAPHTGAVVQISPLPHAAEVDAYVRVNP